MKKLLIYCPSITGHGQIYCNVLTEWALSRNYKVVLAFGGIAIPRQLKRKRRFYRLLLRIPTLKKILLELYPIKVIKYYLIRKNSVYLDYYKNNNNVELLNILKEFNSLKNHNTEVRLITNLQKYHKPDTTILAVCGEDYKNTFFIHTITNLFNKNKMFLSPTYLIDINTSFYYKNFLIRLIGFLKIWLIKSIDKFIIIDKYLYEKYPLKRIGYIPDIYQSYNVTDSENPDKELMLNFNKFLSNNKDKEKILFFGYPFKRKGYHTLLKLVISNDEYVFIHCGKFTMIQEDKKNEIDKLIRKLRNENRIYFVDRFLTNEDMISKFFKSVNFIVLAYENHYQSSGILYQALMYGKPVIVPNIGFMGKLVKEEKLGLLYEHRSYKDLNKKVKNMQKKYTEFEPSISKFCKHNSKEVLFRALDNNIKGS